MMTHSAIRINRMNAGIWRAVPWLSQAVMLPPAFVFMVITLRYLTDPAHAVSGTFLNTPEAFTDTRVIGAWMLALLILLLTLVASKQRIWLGHLQLAIFMGATLLRVFASASMRPLHFAWMKTPEHRKV